MVAQLGRGSQRTILKHSPTLPFSALPVPPFQKYLVLPTPETFEGFCSAKWVAFQLSSLLARNSAFLSSAKLVTTLPSAFQLPTFYSYHLSCSCCHSRVMAFKNNPSTGFLVEFQEGMKVNACVQSAILNWNSH